MKPSELLKSYESKKFSVFVHILGRILDDIDSRLKATENKGLPEGVVKASLKDHEN